MKEIISIKDAATNMYLGYVPANEDLEVTEEDFLKFAESARRLFGVQVKRYSGLLAAKEIVIVRKNKYAACPVIEEALDFDYNRCRYINTFWKDIKHAGRLS